jgi:hypothetical protein
MMQPSPTQPSTDRSPVLGLAGKDLGEPAVSSSGLTLKQLSDGPFQRQEQSNGSVDRAAND